MARIVVELTNRCNLSCQHCFSGRHGGKDDLPLSILQTVLDGGKALGWNRISFTGGEPTLHRDFPEVLRLTAEAGYRFGMVTNGQNFARIYPLLLPYRKQLNGITFSLDGATEATHDLLRGKGSFRRVLQAMSVCVIQEIPFTLNMVVTAHNRHEIGVLAQLGASLGSRGVRFGHLLHNQTTTRQGFDLSPDERKAVEAEIQSLRAQTRLPIVMAPGYHTDSLFPCAPLQMEEVNVDCHGNLTKCCHLSSHGGNVGVADQMGDLSKTSFVAAYHRLTEENQQFREHKMQRQTEGALTDSDHFPCWFCSLHYEKVGWLKTIPNHPWAAVMPQSAPVPAPFIQLSSILEETAPC